MTQQLDNDGADAVLRELQRIVSDGDGAIAEYMLVLPIVNEAEAVAFLQTVPTGATVEELHEIALAYRQKHPQPLIEGDRGTV